jgi:hypothetical protein
VAVVVNTNPEQLLALVASAVETVPRPRRLRRDRVHRTPVVVVVVLEALPTHLVHMEETVDLAL